MTDKIAWSFETDFVPPRFTDTGIRVTDVTAYESETGLLLRAVFHLPALTAETRRMVVDAVTEFEDAHGDVVVVEPTFVWLDDAELLDV